MATTNLYPYQRTYEDLFLHYPVIVVVVASFPLLQQRHLPYHSTVVGASGLFLN